MLRLLALLLAWREPDGPLPEARKAVQSVPSRELRIGLSASAHDVSQAPGFP